MKKPDSNFIINPELINEDLKANWQNLQNDYKHIRTIVLVSSIIGFLSFVLFWYGGELFYTIITPFLFGSFVGFVKKRKLQAIYSGLACSLIITIHYFLYNYTSKNEFFLTVLWLTKPYLYLIFIIIYGLIFKKKFKVILLICLGAFVACYINHLIMPDYNRINLKLELNNYYQSLSKIDNIIIHDLLYIIPHFSIITFINHLIFPTIFWYLIILFESLNYKNVYKKYFRRIFEFNRRLDRKNYTMVFIYCSVIGIYLNYGLIIFSLLKWFPAFYIALYIFFSSIFIIQSIKRLLDANQSPWYLFLSFMPIINIYLIILLFKKGYIKDNIYGISLYK